MIMTLLQIEEEPEEEPEEPAEDDSEDKEETVDEDDDEETVRTLHTLLLEENVKLRIQMMECFTLLTFL